MGYRGYFTYLLSPLDPPSALYKRGPLLLLVSTAPRFAGGVVTEQRSFEECL